MKKVNLRKFLFGLFFITFALCFNSCDSFLNGSVLAKELENSIAYQNAPSFTVRVAAATDTGTFEVGGGEHDLKVTDSLLISFSKNKGYRFIKWISVQKSDESISMDEYVSFEDAASPETKLKLIKEPNEEILIKPLCEQLITYSVFPLDSSEGVERDSAIKFNFASNLSKENDLSAIEISVSGYNGDGFTFFNNPIVEGKQLVIPSNSKNRIPVIENSTRTVTVKIPKEFKYVTDSGELDFVEDIVHVYTINSTTVDTTSIHYGMNTPNTGCNYRISAGLTGSYLTQEYYIGTTDNVVLNIADGYRFLGWECQESGAFIMEPSKENGYDENGYNPDLSVVNVKITIINSYANVNLIAKVEKIPTANVSVESKKGKISPNGSVTCKEGSKLSINFNEDSEYQFIKWTVTPEADADGNKPSFEQIDKSETKFILPSKLKDGTVFSVTPECVKKPKIVSATPGYDASGVYRDRTIVLLFDKEVEPSSIYWTKAELDDLLGEEKENYTCVKTGKTDANGNDYYYKYTNNSDENDVHFKNISITKVEDENTNFLKHYKMPTLDADNPRFLRIPVIRESEPPVAVNILVTISKDVGIRMDNIEPLVTLKEDYVFSYRTNGSTDERAPEFHAINKGANGADFFVGRAKLKDGSTTEYCLRANESILESKILKVNNEDVDTGLTELKDPASFKKNNLFNKYGSSDSERTLLTTSDDLYVYGTIEDGASGPASLQWTLTKIDNDYYPLNNLEPFEKKGQIADMVISGTTGTVDERVPLSSYNLTEGVYKLTLKAYDVNENVGERSYYFIWDNVKPEPSTLTFVTKARDTFEVKVENSSDNHAETKIGNTSFSNNETKDVVDSSVTSRNHTLTVIEQDYVGNKIEYTKTFTTIPKIGDILYSDGYWSEAYISTKTPAGVICDVSNLKEVYIWDLYESKGTYVWWEHTDRDPCSDTRTDLYEYYKSVTLSDGTSFKMHTAPGIKWTRIMNNSYSNLITSKSIFYYVKQKNTSQSRIEWFIPSCVDFDAYILKNYSVLKTVYSKLSSLNPTFITENKEYWTSTPSYRRRNAIAISFGGSGSAYYVYDKNEAENKCLCVSEDDPQNGDNKQKSGEYVRSSLYTTTTSSGNTSGNQIITHAMGLVNLSN